MFRESHRHRLHAQVGGPCRGNGAQHEEEEDAELFHASFRRMSNTRPRLPDLTFPEHLPVSARRADIAAALAAHPVLIVCGETGSGKTTQLPKIALAAGRGVNGRVGMTQPRRIAAKTVAHRIAQETQTELGGLVGWQVRFTDQVGPDSRIKVMTDGILLAETQSDPEFRAYDTLILDEAHERSLNIDFLLGYLKTLLPRRPELRLVISSATLEAERFSAYFSGAPVIEVSGRTYPVEMRYRAPLPPPPGEGARRAGEGATSRSAQVAPSPLAPPPEGEGDMAALLHAVDELAAEGPGDILVFLPGEREIRDAMEDLRKHHPPHTEILPLFARLSVAEQERVFASHPGRRIVLATNVAETSLTVPGIRYVVDAGLARVKRYSLRNKIEQLKIEKVSQASANQRAGRCGRVAAGVCIRLFDEQDFLARPQYTTPELLRSSLAGVILRMKALRLPEIDVFPFLDAPEPKRVRDGQQLLLELGALDEAGGLTAVGRQLAHLPLDPRIGRLLIAAKEKAVLHEALVIAAFLSVQDPRDRPLEAQQAADEKHRRFADANSDFIAILKLWNYQDELNTHRKSQRKFRDALKADFLSPLRVREWRDIYGQLSVQVKELGWKVDPPPPPGEGARRAGEGATPHSPPPQNLPSLPHPTPPPEGEGASLGEGATVYAPLHQALMTGLLGNLGMLTEDGVYLGAREMKFLPFPGSSVKKKPKWVMAAEIVETRRVYARTLAKVEPEWIEHIARPLLKISYSDPHWAKKPAHVAASMRATLYGLPVVNGRKVHYGPIDPVLSRELFLRGALVAGDWDTRAPFFQHNRRLLQEVEDLAQRTRNARLYVDEQTLYAFFDARVPAGIHNGAAFDKWRREIERTQPKALFLTREILLGRHANAEVNAFPPRFASLDLELSYRFEPGAEEDGVTLVVPLAALNQIPALACEWLVPGLLEEKIAALIKTLPQGIRRAFVPVPEYARAAVAQLPSPAGGRAGDEGATPVAPLADALAAFLTKATGQTIPRDAWRPEALPPHLHMNFRVVDERGKTLAAGRDLAALRAQLGQAATAELARSTQSYERERITRWNDLPNDGEDLPEQVEILAGQRTVAAFPALEDAPGNLRLRLFDHAAAAHAAHKLGVAQLVWLQFPDLHKQTARDLAARLKTACLQYALLFKGRVCEDLTHDLLIAAARAAMQDRTPRTRADFSQACTQARPLLPQKAALLAEIVLDTLAATQRLGQALERAPAQAGNAVADLRRQLAGLVFPGYLSAHAPERLNHLPRYLKAMELRLSKLPEQTARDQGSMNEMAPLLAAWRQRADKLASQGREDAAMEDFRWRLEELRVGLFAQTLRTPEPVSAKRLEKRWSEMTR
ncbi:MAG: ATP-dependent RNA helicase HrpA [Betaproteobacteria bacterium]|nr:ATP-dependent RNA helicase HrpA [Betaproteobacteria bacterium]